MPQSSTELDTQKNRNQHTRKCSLGLLIKYAVFHAAERISASVRLKLLSVMSIMNIVNQTWLKVCSKSAIFHRSSQPSGYEQLVKAREQGFIVQEGVAPLFDELCHYTGFSSPGKEVTS